MEVSQLWTYPVKSCRGIALQHARLNDTGFPFDRNWMIVRDPSGSFVTQRQFPKLTLVEPSIDAASIEAGPSNVGDGAQLTLRAPGMKDLRISLRKNEAAPLMRVTVWEWTGMAADAGNEAALWFSNYLYTPCRLVRYLGAGHMESRDATERKTDEKYAVNYHAGFADGYTFLLTSQSSLKDLNERASIDLEMRRFRPNIVIAGAQPWEEDNWLMSQLTTSSGKVLNLQAVKPCARCRTTRVEPNTAEMDEEPLETMSTFRTGADLGWASHDKAWTHWAFFGVNVVSRDSGVVAVGDKFCVLSRHNGWH